MPEATSNVIALSNLHLQTTRMEVAQEVHKIFRPGNIFLIRWPPVAPPLDNTQHNGICVIEYHNMEAAQRAIHAFCGAGLSLRGQRVKVGPAKLVVSPFAREILPVVINTDIVMYSHLSSTRPNHRRITSARTRVPSQLLNSQPLSRLDPVSLPTTTSSPVRTTPSSQTDGTQQQPNCQNV